jgi:hypothetical protein
MNRGNPGDVAFYQAACAGTESVLELGVGSARVLSRLTIRTRVGVDNDSSMLELAREHLEDDVPLLLGDMAHLELGRRFDRVLIPYNGLLCVPRESQLACLIGARTHLAEGGELLFDIYLGDDLDEDAGEVTSEPEEDEPEFLVEMTVADRVFRVFEQNSWWPSKQLMDVHYLLQTPDETLSLRIDIAHHYLRKVQVEGLLRAAGFERFTWGALPGGEQMTIRASS